ncbi:hypothetical protein ATEG_00645 [Aspergillus terreus NIH2624]|uniref:Uncharacterized protein n=1 Tax=Aspergillus terreus (strain NIH 2624 / FGSC A1156) TaxID=341663 RepID=Q0D089_ASPTN|nr:uncharacterized protein ATEG_00645 [Aspergillus terreus NIH2624]EAU39291.1 hypothetical protein ATEG_00645 [Aspergillus terreus NIH2624]
MDQSETKNLVLTETHGQSTLVLKLNRPAKRNALSQALINSLLRELENASTDPRICSVVITGSDTIFSAGADIGEIWRMNTQEARQRRYLEDLCHGMERFCKPIIAAVEGKAADFVVAARDADFRLPETSIGLIPGAGGTQRLTAAIGKYRALSGEEAFSAGLVSKLVGKGQALSGALEIAERLASQSLPTVMLAKEAICRADHLHHDHAFERSLYYAAFGTRDMVEGVTSFLEKRAPVWENAVIEAGIGKTPLKYLVQCSYEERATSTALEPVSPAHRTHSTPDEESQPPPQYTRENDPFQLSSKLKSAAEISQIQPRANTARKRDRCTPTVVGRAPLSLASKRQQELQTFYHAQNENIERMLRPVEEHVRAARELNANNQLKYKIAVYGSFAANVILSVLQLYGAIASGSLSLFTTMADAIFDPMSNLTLLLCNKAVNRVDPRRFPAGKARIETAGNIGFCFLMTAVSLILIAFSVRDLAVGSNAETTEFHLPSVIAVAVAFCTKFALFVYCFALRHQVSQIRILWEDHRNDLFINGFGILTSVGGSKLRWWIDPMGAVILSVLISGLWLHTAYHEFQLLIGVTADTKMQQLITYISMTHSPFITAIDTVRAYTSGPRLLVEVDIVMDPDESLRATHDVAEELQMKLESLPDVERAYVHVDYETTHKPEHFLKKEL